MPTDISEVLKHPSYRIRAAYRGVFSGPDGELVLQDLLKFCNGGNQSFVPGEPYETAFNEGKRRVALRIVAFCEMTDLQMMEIAVRKAVMDDGV